VRGVGSEQRLEDFDARRAGWVIGQNDRHRTRLRQAGRRLGKISKKGIGRSGTLMGRVERKIGGDKRRQPIGRRLDGDGGRDNPHLLSAERVQIRLQLAYRIG
jgi:hypothetical protein